MFCTIFNYFWATIAWWFGIPTSESHALIAGITGAAMAVQGGLSAVNTEEWIKVIYGLILSVFLSFPLGWSIVKVVEFSFRDVSQKHRFSSIMLKSLVAPACHLCMVLKMDRNL